MKNHNVRLVGSQAMPKAHATTHISDKRRGRGRYRGNTSWSCRGGRDQGYNNTNRAQDCGKRQNNKNFKYESNSTQQDISQKNVCYRYGCEGHWS